MPDPTSINTATGSTATTAMAGVDAALVSRDMAYPLLALPSADLDDEEGAMIDRMIVARLVAP